MRLSPSSILLLVPLQRGLFSTLLFYYKNILLTTTKKILRNKKCKRGKRRRRQRGPLSSFSPKYLGIFSWSCFSSCLVGRERRYTRVREYHFYRKEQQTRASYPVCLQTGVALLLPFFHQKKCYSDDSDK